MELPYRIKNKGSRVMERIKLILNFCLGIVMLPLLIAFALGSSLYLLLTRGKQGVSDYWTRAFYIWMAEDTIERARRIDCW